MTTQQPEALAADHSEQTLEMVARWYMIDKDGMATLCTDREDAEKEAKNANMAWPHTAPHRAVQLVEVADVEALRTGYAAARAPADSVLEDAARYRWLRRKFCLTGNVDGTCCMHAINLPASIKGWPEPIAAEVMNFCDAAIDAARKQGANHD